MCASKFGFGNVAQFIYSHWWAFLSAAHVLWFWQEDESANESTSSWDQALSLNMKMDLAIKEFETAQAELKRVSLIFWRLSITIFTDSEWIWLLGCSARRWAPAVYWLKSPTNHLCYTSQQIFCLSDTHKIHLLLDYTNIFFKCRSDTWYQMPEITVLRYYRASSKQVRLSEKASSLTAA